MKPYLLTYHDPKNLWTFNAKGRQEILNYLDSRREVLNWLAIFPTTIVIISEHNAHQLAELLRQRFSYYFIITEIPPGNNDGWLSGSNWEFINNPKSSGRWPFDLSGLLEPKTSGLSMADALRGLMGDEKTKK